MGAENAIHVHHAAKADERHANAHDCDEDYPQGDGYLVGAKSKADDKLVDPERRTRDDETA
jgi:hypothetical protein